MTPCAREDCGHPHTDHDAISGCLAGGRGNWCQCPAYAIPMPTTVAALEEGRARREEGMAAAGTTANGPEVTEWRANAADALAKLIAAGETFTADDLTTLAGMPPRPNMVGPVFMAAARQGRIRATGETKTAGARAASHARALRVWVTTDDTGRLTPGEAASLSVARRLINDAADVPYSHVRVLVAALERLA